MLEKVSQQPASSYSSPLELAQKWRIPVLSVRSLWKWIAKVEEAYLAKLNEKKRDKLLESKFVVCAREEAPFIKIESAVRLVFIYLIQRTKNYTVLCLWFCLVCS